MLISNAACLAEAAICERISRQLTGVIRAFEYGVCDAGLYLGSRSLSLGTANRLFTLAEESLPGDELIAIDIKTVLVMVMDGQFYLQWRKTQQQAKYCQV